MNVIVKAMRKPEKKSPAMPSTAEIASGTDDETSSDPACTFSAAPLSPSHDSSSDSRSCSTVCGRSWRVANAPHERHQEEKREHEHRDGRAEDRDCRREPA